jgi:hypothetical protein
MGGALRLRRLDKGAHRWGAARWRGMLGHVDGSRHGGVLGNGAASSSGRERERTGGAGGGRGGGDRANGVWNRNESWVGGGA